MSGTSAAKKDSTKKLDGTIMRKLRAGVDPKDVKAQLGLHSIWRVYDAKRRSRARRASRTN